MKLAIIIPAFEEEESVGTVVRRCRAAAPRHFQARIVVADNGSRDGTARAAQEAGAEVVTVPRRGYGAACQGAIAFLAEWPDLFLFIDADGSSRPEQMSRLLDPLREGRAELVIGCRPPGAPMTPPQRWGNRIATLLLALRWGKRFRDIGPYRAITREAYRRLGMKDRTWGWTVEMQILALLRGLRVEEIPVSWDRRLAGVSKISGTVCGVTRAGTRILWTLACYSLQRPAAEPKEARDLRPLSRVGRSCPSGGIPPRGPA